MDVRHRFWALEQDRLQLEVETKLSWMLIPADDPNAAPESQGEHRNGLQHPFLRERSRQKPWNRMKRSGLTRERQKR